MESLNEHIDELIADKIAGQIQPENERLLEHYINTDKDVREKWENTLAAVNLYKATQHAEKIDEEEGWEKLLTKLEREDNVTELPKRKKYTWLVAAGFLLPLILTGLWFWVYDKGTTAQNEKEDHITVVLSDGTTYDIEEKKGLTTEEIRFDTKSAVAVKDKTGSVNEIITLNIPNGKTYSVTLSDGTQVKLNSATTFKFPLSFDGDSREVDLDGEAYFEVVKQHNKPFVVKTKEMDVKVLGTKFNVNTYSGNLAQTSLLEGKVAVSDREINKEILLIPGQAAIKRPDGTITTEEFSKANVLGWLQGIYYFNNITLEDIVHVAKRVTGQQLQIADKKIAKVRFTGALERDKPIDILLNNVKSSSSVQYKIEDGIVYFY